MTFVLIVFVVAVLLAPTLERHSVAEAFYGGFWAGYRRAMERRGRLC